MTGDEVKAARLELGMTQAELAAALELAEATGKDTVRSWEKDRRAIAGPSRVALRLMLEQRRLVERIRELEEAAGSDDTAERFGFGPHG